MENKILPLSRKNSSNSFVGKDGDAGSAAKGQEYQIDLNEQLIKNKKDSFFMRVHSNAMKDAGICNGDVVIVDRSIPARSGKVIIALVGGEMLIRRLEIVQGKQRLIPGTEQLSPIEVDPGNYSVWGVVTYVIRAM